MSPDRDWQAESDADTLVRVKEIESDGARFARARAAAHTRALRLAQAAGAKVEDHAANQLAEGFRKL
jgi:hypothetical protein